MSIRMATVTLLVLSLGPPVEAQQGAMSAAQVAQIKKEVADAVHTYYRLFTEHDMTSLGTKVTTRRGCSWARTASRSIKRRPRSPNASMHR